MAQKKQAADRMADAVGRSSAATYDLLEKLGAKIARREKYKQHAGIEAVHFYLVNKHHWTPAKVRSMTLDDVWFAVAEE